MVPFLLLPSFPEKSFFINYLDKASKIQMRKRALEIFFHKLRSNSLLNHFDYLELLRGAQNKKIDLKSLILTSPEKLLDTFYSRDLLEITTSPSF